MCSPGELNVLWSASRHCEMKWLPPNPPVQFSSDKRYCIVRATQENWIAYEMGPTAGIQLGVRVTDDRARELCEEHERDLIALRKRA